MLENKHHYNRLINNVKKNINIYKKKFNFY